MPRPNRPLAWLQETVARYQPGGWPAECVPWPWRLDVRGDYGRISYGGRETSAHRVAWFFAYGEWPQETLDHVRERGCGRKDCVNVAHLEDVSAAENARRGYGAVQRAKTHCPQGHPYSGENLVQTDRARRCRVCRRTASLSWSRRNSGRPTGS